MLVMQFPAASVITPTGKRPAPGTLMFFALVRGLWERAVEEVLLLKAILRFVPDVMTERLRVVLATADDVREVHIYAVSYGGADRVRRSKARS